MNLAQHILVFGVRMYRWILSPAKLFLFGSLSQCRFNPTCSAYAIQAIQRHGACRGTWLALKRICRCHPWGDCGQDPVPPQNRHSECLQAQEHANSLHVTPADSGQPQIRNEKRFRGFRRESFRGIHLRFHTAQTRRPAELRALAHSCH